jgi:hypothetical protein
MPNSTCLHIQDRESGPIRVLEIPWISVRIGRGAFCDVKLADPELPAEACRLLRRGSAWQLVAIASGTPVLLGGQPVQGACPLPYDVPFCVGRYDFTLRPDRSSEPDWKLYERPMPPQLAAPDPLISVVAVSEAPDAREQIPVAHGPPRAGAAETDWFPSSRRGPGSKPSPEALNLKNNWEARWREADAEIRARARHYTTGDEPSRVGRDARPESAVLKEELLHRPEAPRPAPDPPPTRAATAGYAKVQRVWSPPAVEARLPYTPHPHPSRDWTVGDRNDPILRIPEVPSSTDPAPDPVRNLALLVPVPVPVPEPEHRAAEAPPAPDAPESPPAGPFPQAIALPLDTDAAVFDPDPAAPAGGALAEQEPGVPQVERVGGEQERIDPSKKTEPARPSRSGAEIRSATILSTGLARDSHRPGASRVKEEAFPVGDEWPSAKEILAMHRAVTRPRAPAAPGRPAQKGSLPTSAREAERWMLPAWLAGPPLAFLVLTLGTVGSILSWWWAGDSYAAAIMTDRLVSANPTVRRSTLPESIVAPSGNWARSTAQHLAHWAIYASTCQPADRDRLSIDAPTLVNVALEASLINATARLTLAQLERLKPDSPLSSRSLGLSRDALCLSYSASRLAANGKRDAALRLYHQALVIASHRQLSHSGIPRFNDDPGVPRYLLPGEENVREILRELLSRNEWTFHEWSEILPRDTTVPLAAARLLREQGRSEAEALLDLVLVERGSPEMKSATSPVLIAASAEACAMRSRWREALTQYRQAIDLMQDDTIKRAWWFNLADVASRLDDEGQQQLALRAALAVTASDEISRRATELRRGATQRSRLRSVRARAN